MPLPLVPFILGAAAGAVATYLITDRRAKGSAKAADRVPELTAVDSEESGSKGDKGGRSTKDE